MRAIATLQPCGHVQKKLPDKVVRNTHFGGNPLPQAQNARISMPTNVGLFTNAR
jgi:hypothetical protein